MKKFEVEKLVSKSIIITVILLCLMLGTTMIQNGYFNALTYMATSKVTIAISVLFVLVAVAMVVLGIMKKNKYYFYATFFAVIAIFVMLLKINYEIKALQFSIGTATIKLYMVSIAVFVLAIIATWINAVLKIVRK